MSMFEDDDEIQVPKSIQDLIEKNIRTLSNSLSTAKSQSAQAVSQVISDNVINLLA
jgi:hypothetical protein